MDPIVIVEFVGSEEVTTPEYEGPVVTLVIRVPVSRVTDIDRNDTLRREFTGAIASAIPSAPVGG